ncbi:MFS transporter [Novosphingobium flavum]|uniref:MFS transporter n=1 Tax=Novosphingobium flavum TaxID=1778672 RepID=A0A7X1KMK0_9SPHN|nr:MFS transporter [Novosphingobium flavum]
MVEVGYAIAGVALHGICNDSFIIIAAMYIARVAPADLQAQAQGWLTLMLSGFGQAIGSGIAGAIFAARVLPRGELGAAAWAPLWIVPIGLALVTALVWATLFRPVAQHPGGSPPTH